MDEQELAAGIAAGEIFTDVRGYMAQLVVLKDEGNLPNATFGDDPDSQRFVRDVRRLNPRWKLGQIAKVPEPARSRPAPRPLPAQRPRERRARRVARTAGSRGDPHPDPDDPPLPPELTRLCANARAAGMVHISELIQELFDSIAAWAA